MNPEKLKKSLSDIPNLVFYFNDPEKRHEVWPWGKLALFYAFIIFVILVTVVNA